MFRVTKFFFTDFRELHTAQLTWHVKTQLISLVFLLTSLKPIFHSPSKSFTPWPIFILTYLESVSSEFKPQFLLSRTASTKFATHC